MLGTSSSSVLSLHRGLLPKGAHASVFPSIHNSGSILLSFTSLSKRTSVFDKIKQTLLLRRNLATVWRGALCCGWGAPSRLSAQNSVKAGGLFPAIITAVDSTTWFCRLTSRSTGKPPSHLGSSTICILQRAWCRLSYGCGGRARAWIRHVVAPPRIRPGRVGWSGSAHSPPSFDLSTHALFIFVVRRPSPSSLRLLSVRLLFSHLSHRQVPPACSRSWILSLPLPPLPLPSSVCLRFDQTSTCPSPLD